MTTDTPVKTANDIQVSGDHYKTAYQHWDMLVTMGYTSQYFVGQATKYISRWRKKNGIPDLKKGQHFVQKLIELTEEHGSKFLQFGHLPDWDIENMIMRHAEQHLRRFFEANDCKTEEQAICVTILFANNVTGLKEAHEAIERLIKLTVANEEAAIFGGKNMQKPVSADFDFIEYTDHDTVRWRKKDTGEEQDLPLTTPPVFANWR